MIVSIRIMKLTAYFSPKIEDLGKEARKRSMGINTFACTFKLIIHI